MTVGLKLRNVIDEIGTQDFFHAFFSTVHHHLEDGEWGSSYPTLLKELYQGKLSSDQASPALAELNTISEKLTQFNPDQVIWDCDDLSAQPPWGKNISDEITDLSNYFVTSTGRDLISTMREALEAMVEKEGMLEVVSI